MEWFVQTNSFAAPFFSDTGTRYVEAETAAEALERVAATYAHPCGLFSAAAWPSADAMHKGEPAAATWLCNHEIERKRLTEGLGWARTPTSTYRPACSRSTAIATPSKTRKRAVSYPPNAGRPAQ